MLRLRRAYRVRERQRVRVARSTNGVKVTIGRDRRFRIKKGKKRKNKRKIQKSRGRKISRGGKVSLRASLLADFFFAMRASDEYVYVPRTRFPQEAR